MGSLLKPQGPVDVESILFVWEKSEASGINESDWPLS
jgi:hypothetical protein